MTPTQSILERSAAQKDLIDASGRRIRVRGLTALDTLRLFKAAGPQLALNDAWMNLATLAVSVVSIDEFPMPAPTGEAQIEMIVERLGDVGLNAVAEALEAPTSEPQTDTREHVGNLLGTPT